MSRAIVICGFPGVGKTHLVELHRRGPLKVVDLDPVAASYKWQEADDGARVIREDWPENYIQEVLRRLDYADIILVAASPDVRRGLKEAKIDFILVYPTPDQKQEYLRRYIDRRKPARFVNTMNENFEDWVGELRTETGGKHVVLEPGQYLNDVILTDETPPQGEA